MCLDESGTDEIECIGRRVSGAIMSLVNTKTWQLECAGVLHESLLVPALIYGSETMIRREEERFWIRVRIVL